MNPMAIFTWGASLMVAPHTLALLGNVAGAQQLFFPVCLAVAAAFYWINALSMADLSTLGPTRPSDAVELMIAGLSWTSRWIVTIMLSTVLLVTAGFAFNETFIYWFPNFAFAFVLLGVLALVHLLGQKAVRWTQTALSVIVLSGLSVLLAMGVWRYMGAPPAVVQKPMAALPSSMAGVALIFIGFDLVLDHGCCSRSKQAGKLMIGCITIMAFVLGAWGWASLQAVPAEKLSVSYIPHIIAARNIGGNAGRMIMAAIVIAGSAAAVNALLSSVSRPGFLSADRPLTLRPLWMRRLERPASRIIIAALVIGWMMAGGVAGTEIIDSYVRAGLLVWLLFYAAIHIALLSHGLPVRRKSPVIWPGWLRPVAGATAMTGSSVALLVTDPEMASMGGLILIVLLPVTAALWAKGRWFTASDSERNPAEPRPFRLNR